MSSAHRIKCPLLQEAFITHPADDFDGAIPYSSARARVGVGLIGSSRIVHGCSASCSTTGRDGIEEYLALTNLWIDEKEYDPKLDGAARDRARTSEAVRKTVEAVNQKRVALGADLQRHRIHGEGSAHQGARDVLPPGGVLRGGVQELQRERQALIPYYR